MVKAKKALKSVHKKYSVLLLYPDFMADSYGESYYTFVTAKNSKAAVLKAQKEAMKTNGLTDTDPNDFKALLVTEGHNLGHEVC